MRARSTSKASAITHTWLTSPTVKSSAAGPVPAYWPWISMPGVDGAPHHLAVDVGAEHVALADDVAGAEQAPLGAGALQLGLGLAVAVLRVLQVARGHGVDGLQLLLALVVVLGGDDVGVGLGDVGGGHADVGDSTTARACPFFTCSPRWASIRVTRPVTGENTVVDAQIVVSDLAAGDEERAHLVLLDEGRRELGFLGLLGADPHLVGGRGAGLGREALAAATVNAEEQERQEGSHHGPPL